jgi:AraC-like DNA-binding protein
MTFNLNLYSTPLLFGFVQGWVYALLFWVRGTRQNRLSDWLFGALLAAMTFEIWEYMLGFAGVEILWNELEFFPRTFGFLVMPLAYFYLKSQFNAAFRLRWADAKHALPFVVYATYHLVVFVQGKTFVQHWLNHVHYAYHLETVEWALLVLQRVLYFYWAFQLYQEYRTWTYSQFSDPDAVSFGWFRNFLLAFAVAYLVGLVMTLLGWIFKLDFWHDWWDELFFVGLIYYVAITGYGQTQPRKLLFTPVTTTAEAVPTEEVADPKTEKMPTVELEQWKKRIEKLMTEEKLYLESELTLTDLAQRLKTNVSVLSAVINGAFNKNFNDFVNEYRVEEVKRMLKDPAAKHLSLLGIGIECGFNSKSTFNRAFRKATGVAPSEYHQN